MLKNFDKTVLDVLEEPLTIEQMKEQMKNNNLVTGIVNIHISDIIDNDFEGFLDILSEKLVGSPCLMSIDYKAVAANNNEIYLQVFGDASSVINFESEKEE